MPAPRGQFHNWFHEYQPPEPEEIVLSVEQQDAVALWGSDVWEFCTGVWPLQTHTGQKGAREPRPICWTQDKMLKAARPFPASYTYLRDCFLHPIFHAPRVGEDGRPLKHRFVAPKPRQLFVTNGILVGCLWDVLFHEATEWLIAKNKSTEAERFLKLRVRYTYKRLPRWFAGITGPEGWIGYRNVARKPAGQFAVEETEGRITAVSRTFGESGEAIGETASVVLDECVRLRNLGAVWDAADAMAPVMVAVSAPPEMGARVDPLSVAFFRELCEGLPRGTFTRTVLNRADPLALEELEAVA